MRYSRIALAAAASMVATQSTDASEFREQRNSIEVYPAEPHRMVCCELPVRSDNRPRRDWQDRERPKHRKKKGKR